jgi:phosphatidate cytidylyltransferase
VSDRFDDDGPQPSPTEGVRILGAEEAQAALDAGAVRAPVEQGTDRPDRADRAPGPAKPPAAARPAAPAPTPQTAVPMTDAPYEDELDLGELEAADELPPRFPDEGPTWSATTTPEMPTGEMEVPPLPHWSEPATGAVPAIFADDGTGDDPDADADLDAWASLSGSQPRFRAEGSDWAEADFAEGEFADDEPRTGALSNEAPVDEEVAFAEAIEARRPRRAPAAPTAPTAPAEPRPARRAPAGTATAPRRRPAPTGYATEAARSSGRDLPTALATAAIIAAVALLCFNLGTAATSVLAAVIVGACALEFANGLQEKGFRPATLLAALGSAGLVLAARNFGVDAYPVVFGVVTVATFLWFLFEITPGRPALGIATTLMTFAYVGGLGGFAGLLLAPDPDGVGLILGVAICVIASDVFGFFVGSQFGKTPIASRVSPHKSVQGTLAGMAASVVFGWLVAGNIGPWDASSGFALGALVAVGALLGDLSESLVKRDLGIKDFGSVLPGHGGVLDRFDALLFCLPIAYFLAAHLDLL